MEDTFDLQMNTADMCVYHGQYLHEEKCRMEEENGEAVVLIQELWEIISVAGEMMASCIRAGRNQERLEKSVTTAKFFNRVSMAFEQAQILHRDLHQDTRPKQLQNLLTVQQKLVQKVQKLLAAKPICSLPGLHTKFALAHTTVGGAVERTLLETDEDAVDCEKYISTLKALHARADELQTDCESMLQKDLMPRWTDEQKKEYLAAWNTMEGKANYRTVWYQSQAFAEKYGPETPERIKVLYLLVQDWLRAKSHQIAIRLAEQKKFWQIHRRFIMKFGGEMR